MILALHRTAGASYGELPGIGPVVQLGAALQWDHLRLELDAHFGSLRAKRHEDGRGADLRSGFAIFRGCGVVHYRPRKLEFPLCAGIEAGALFGRGIGIGTVVRGQSVPWVALDLNVGMAWAPHPRLAVGWFAEPWVSLLDSTFRVDGLGELWRPNRVGLRLLASVETRF